MSTGARNATTRDLQALDARRYPRQTVRSEDYLPENQKDLRRG